MSLRHRLAGVLGSLLRSRRDPAELRAEMEGHLEDLTDAHRQTGLSATQARLAARRAFGGVTQALEASYEASRFAAVETAARDLRFATRLLARDRWVTLALVLTIAVSVAGAATVYSSVASVLLKPSAFPQSEQLVRLWEVHPGARPPITGAFLTFPTYEAWSRESKALQAIGGFNIGDHTVGIDDRGQRWRGAQVTPSVFAVFRMPPRLGRLFVDADADDGALPVVILSHDVWQARFDGDSAALDTTITIDGVTHRIVGVAAAGFAFPGHDSNWIDAPRPIAFYTVLRPRLDASASAVGLLNVVARIARGASLTQVEAEGTLLARAVPRPSAEVAFGTGGEVEVRAQGLSAFATKGLRPLLLVAAVAIGLVLVVAWANVANLYMTRATRRSRELAIRVATGANRARIVRQLLTESLVVAVAGGTLGVLAGWQLTRVLPAIAPVGLAGLLDSRPSFDFLAVAAIITALLGIASGVLPSATHARLAEAALARVDQRTGASASGERARRFFLVVQAALAVLLTVGTVLLGRSFINLIHVNLGYRASHVLTAELYGGGAAAQLTVTAETLRAILERIRAIPAVAAAGAGNMLPFSGVLSSVGFTLPGVARPDGLPVNVQAWQAVVTPGYPEALGMTLHEGRFFMPQDLTASSRALMFNRAFVRTYLADGAPVTGRQFVGLFPRILGKSDAVFEVVGVVNDVLLTPDDKPRPLVYVLNGNGFGPGSNTLAVRTTGEPTALVSDVRRIVEQEAPAATLDRMSALTDKLDASLAQRRFLTVVVTTFSLLALLLAAVGLYAVASFQVEQRRAEIGLRLALGASQRAVIASVMRDGLSMTAIGLALGVALAALTSRLLAGALFGIAPLDGIAFAAAPALLFLVAAAAGAIPALRAARLEPMPALNAE